MAEKAGGRWKQGHLVWEGWSGIITFKIYSKYMKIIYAELFSKCWFCWNIQNVWMFMWKLLLSVCANLLLLIIVHCRLGVNYQIQRFMQRFCAHMYTRDGKTRYFAWWLHTIERFVLGVCASIIVLPMTLWILIWPPMQAFHCVYEHDYKVLGENIQGKSNLHLCACKYPIHNVFWSGTL